MKKILMLCAAVALGLSSCVNDKGHYEYKPAGGVTFPDEASITEELTHVVLVGEDIVIKPKFDINNPELGDSFSFQWHRKQSGTSYIPVTEITNDPNLQLTVPDGNEYEYLFMVKNDRTGVWYKAPWTHKVRGEGNPFAKGFLFLVQTDANNFNVDMLVDNNNGYEISNDMLSLPIEEERFPATGKAKQIVTLNNGGSNVTGIPNYAIFILSDQNCGIVRNNNFAMYSTLKDAVSSFSEYKNDGDFVAEKIISDGWCSTNSIVTRSMAFRYKGNWFWSSLLYGFRWENAVNIPYSSDKEAYFAPVGKEIAVTDKAVLMTGYNRADTAPHEMMIMWSEERDMFLVKTGNGSLTGDRSASLTSKWLVDEGTTSGNEELDLVAAVNSETSDNFNVKVAGRELLHLGAMEDNNNKQIPNGRITSYAITKEPEGKYAFFTLLAKGGGGEMEKGNYYEFPASTQVGNAKFFAASKLWNYIYFSTSTGVYSFRKDNLKQEAAVTKAKKGDTTVDIVPAGEEIVVFKSLFGENSYYLGNADSNNNLIVVTRKSNGECTFRMYKQSAGSGDALEVMTYKKKSVVGDVETEVDAFMEFTGLRDIVDVAYKLN